MCMSVEDRNSTEIVTGLRETDSRRKRQDCGRETSRMKKKQTLRVWK